MWKNSKVNADNPFYEIHKDADRSEYQVHNYERKGKFLYSETSIEIHGWNKVSPDYTHLDHFTSGIAKALHPRNIDERTGMVDWKKELTRYPIKYLDSDVDDEVEGETSHSRVEFTSGMGKRPGLKDKK